eukprot:489887_1
MDESQSSPKTIITCALIDASIQTARNCGSLCSFDSDLVRIQDPESGINFAVRVARNLESKTASKNEKVKKNPFLPPFETGLLVCDLPPDHRLLLNKFNLLSRHCLIISRDFRPQGAAMRACDFKHALACVRAVDGVGFYNCGADSGCSQEHFHVQIIPRNLSGSVSTPPDPSALLPIEAIIFATDTENEPFQVDTLPFNHALYVWSADCEITGARAYDAYIQCLEKLRGLGSASTDGSQASYNLLFTTRWLLVVPRLKPMAGPFEFSDDLTETPNYFDINSLGFCG